MKLIRELIKNDTESLPIFKLVSYPPPLGGGMWKQTKNGVMGRKHGNHMKQRRKQSGNNLETNWKQTKNKCLTKTMETNWKQLWKQVIFHMM